MKTKKLKPLSSYEEDLIWMSYRYAIGRHTIAANSHGKDIVKNSYERLKLTPERMHFMAKDINNSIYDNLHYGFFKIDEYTLNTNDIDPLDVFYEFINSENIKDWNELSKYKRVTAYKENNSWKFDKQIDETQKRYISSMDYCDLDVWQIAAKIFSEKYVTVKTNYNGEIKEFECIEVYDKDYNSETIKFIKKYVPVEKYVENPHLYWFINPDFIVN